MKVREILYYFTFSAHNHPVFLSDFLALYGYTHTHPHKLMFDSILHIF